MLDVPRLVHVGASGSFELLVADPHRDRAFEDIGELVLLRVRVRWRGYAHRDGMLDDGERPTRQLAIDLGDRANSAGKRPNCSLSGTDQVARTRHRHRPTSAIFQ